MLFLVILSFSQSHPHYFRENREQCVYYIFYDLGTLFISSGIPFVPEMDRICELQLGLAEEADRKKTFDAAGKLSPNGPELAEGVGMKKKQK